MTPSKPDFHLRAYQNSAGEKIIVKKEHKHNRRGKEIFYIRNGRATKYKLVYVVNVHLRNQIFQS